MSDSKDPIIKINYMIRMSTLDLEKFCEVFKLGKIRADKYCPSPRECEELLVEDLPKYLPFMLWIDETGYDTPENKESRKYLRRLLYSKLITK